MAIVKRMMRWSLLAVFALSLGCGEDMLTRLEEEERDAGQLPPANDDQGAPRTDAGVVGVEPPRPDAGLLAPDAGAAQEDGGVGAPDAGEADAGSVDTPDAAEPPRECYTEPFDPTVSVSDLEQSFNGANAFALVVEALSRRYPAGYDLLVAEANDPYTGSFTDGSSFGVAMQSAMTEVHEATHGWDYGHSLFYQHFDYWLRADLQHSLSFSVDGFPRSTIYGMLEDDSTDLYSGLYLTGDQGTRGFLELLDETNCYINGLGAITAIGEYVPFGISGRDGAVAFLYYVELYLKRARTRDPQLYATMQADAALKEHVKIQWLRTHYFLLFADMLPALGINDAAIRARLYAPDNIAEIAMLIGRCVDHTNCLCD